MLVTPHIWYRGTDVIGGVIVSYTSTDELLKLIHRHWRIIIVVGVLTFVSCEKYYKYKYIMVNKYFYIIPARPLRT